MTTIPNFSKKMYLKFSFKYAPLDSLHFLFMFLNSSCAVSLLG